MTLAVRAIAVGAHYILGAALRAPFTRCCFAQPRAPRSARHFLPCLGAPFRCMPTPRPAFTVAATSRVAHVRELLSTAWQPNICWAGILPAHLLRFPSARVGPRALRNALPTDDSRSRRDSRCDVAHLRVLTFLPAKQFKQWSNWHAASPPALLLCACQMCSSLAVCFLALAALLSWRGRPGRGDGVPPRPRSFASRL
eukprot:6181200-Pleurochrysis_carterae.AAC.3